jgi:hypothetical protein
MPKGMEPLSLGKFHLGRQWMNIVCIGNDKPEKMRMDEPDGQIRRPLRKGI